MLTLVSVLVSTAELPLINSSPLLSASEFSLERQLVRLAISKTLTSIHLRPNLRSLFGPLWGAIALVAGKDKAAGKDETVGKDKSGGKFIPDFD